MSDPRRNAEGYLDVTQPISVPKTSYKKKTRPSERTRT